MDEQRVKSIIESILFVSEKPITAHNIADVLGEGFDTKDVKKILDEMKSSYEERNGGILLREVAGGYQLYTNQENAEYLKKLIDVKPFKLSRAALETLAIVAYRQPITKSELEEIRGVDSSGALRVLIEKKLIRIIGKKDEPGRPFLYGTTKEFMEFFDLKSLAELPTLKDLEQIAREINEESGVAPASSPALTEQSPSTEITNTDVQFTDVKISDTEKNEDGPEQINEELIAEQFDNALNRLEQTNRSIKETLGLNTPEQNSEEVPLQTITKEHTTDTEINTNISENEIRDEEKES